jgi:hypothetical protein
MSVKYYLQPYPLTQNREMRKAHVVINTSHDKDSLVQRMCEKGTTFCQADIDGVLTLLSETVCEELSHGNSINLPFVKMRLAVKGLFQDVSDVFDGKRHQLKIDCRVGTGIKKRIPDIKVEKVIRQLPLPMLISFTDVTTNQINSIATAGGIGKLFGSELDFDSENPAEGLFFVSASAQAFKVAVVAHKTPGTLIFSIPDLPHDDYTLEVRKNFTNQAKLRKGILNGQLKIQ